MSKEAMHTQSNVSRIVACPSCGQQNRLYLQINRVTYQCGHCQHPLPDPFGIPTPPTQSTRSRKFVGLLILAGVLLAGAGLLNFARGILSTGSQSTPIAIPSTSATPTFATPTSASTSAIPTPAPVPASPWPVVSSPSPPLKNRSLPASKVLIPPASGGYGTLKISNGTERDAYVKLIEPTSRQLVAAIYVKSKTDFTTEQIPDGTYELLFVTGEDWDAKTKSFTRDKSFTKFDQSLEFVTTPQEYSIIQLTLNPVVNGNVTLSGVDEQEFGQY